MTLQMNQDDFVFVLPSSFSEAKKMFSWPENPRVKFDLSLPEQFRTGKKPSMVDSLRKALWYSKSLKEYRNIYKPDSVISLDIMSLVPFLPLYLLTSKVKVTGIVYDIYLRNDHLSFRNKFASICRFWVLSKSKLFSKVLILNDRKSSDELNSKFNTNKFVHIPDSFVPLENSDIDFRKEYDITDDAIIFSHFGAITGRKGTIDILRDIPNMHDDLKNKSVFVFAGLVKDDIKEEFERRVASLKNEVRLIVKDEFCSYSFLASLCKASNGILMPYHDTCKSSGLIGYASQFGVPVVAYKGGLLGELISNYELGLLIDKQEGLQDAFLQVSQGQVKIPPKHYCEDNNVESFAFVIRKALNNK